MDVNDVIVALAKGRAFLDDFWAPVDEFVLIGLVWAIMWGVRKWLPGVWETIADRPFGPKPEPTTLRKIWQAIPSMVVGAVLSAFTAGVPVSAALGIALADGVMSLIGAPLIHHLGKWLPIPYEGGSRPAVGGKRSKWRPPSAVAVLALPLVACANPPPPRDIAVHSLNAAGVVIQQAYEAKVIQCLDDHPEDEGRACQAGVDRKFATVFALYDLAGQAAADPERFVAAYCHLVAVSPVDLPAAERCVQ